MKFFTPELYQRFNSPDDEVADRADQEWEEALQEYERHLQRLRGDMPSRVRELADKCCFHDAELLALQEQESEPVFSRSVPVFPFLPLAILTLRQEKQLVVLVYLLWHKVRQTGPPKNWPCSSLKPHWLYDELDADKRSPGLYWQRVLLSDGTQIEIPFFDVFLQTLPLASIGVTMAKRKGA